MYNSSTLVIKDEEDEEPAFLAHEEHGEDKFIEALLMEGDTDAALVADFESAATKFLQEDNDLASAYSAYTKARRRLTEKFKIRGFWSTSKSSFTALKGKGSYAKGSQKGKSNWNQNLRRNFQDRILNSYCRNYNKKDHWKAGVPLQGVRSLHNKFDIDSINSLRKFTNDDNPLVSAFLWHYQVHILISAIFTR